MTPRRLPAQTATPGVNRRTPANTNEDQRKPTKPGADGANRRTPAQTAHIYDRI